MRALFRWLWRFNAIVIAVAGVGAVVVLVLGAATLLPLLAGRNSHDDHQVDATVSPAHPPELRFNAYDFQSGVIIANLVTPGDGRGGSSLRFNDDIVRNLVRFEAGSTTGQRIFTNDAGEVGRVILVDQDCNELESAHPRIGPQPVAMIALWGPPEQNGWRLGVIDVPSGHWREVAANISGLDAMLSPLSSRCRAIVSRHGVHSQVLFGLAGDAKTDEQQITVR